MAKTLTRYVTFNHPDGGMSATFGPGDELPDWASTDGFPPEYLEGGDTDDEAHDAEVAAGPGQVGPPESDEDRKAREDKEAKLKADRDRKAKKRADDKAAADAEALKAAQDAEAKRAAEGGGN
jgi:hypothetical protein